MHSRERVDGYDKAVVVSQDSFLATNAGFTQRIDPRRTHPRAAPVSIKGRTMKNDPELGLGACL
jgi:hypothetical protein